MVISISDEVEGHPGWSIEYTRTQGMDDDTWWVYDAPGGSWGAGEIIGVGDFRGEAIESAEENIWKEVAP